MLYGNTVTVRMTQMHHVTQYRAAYFLLAALDEPDFAAEPPTLTSQRPRRRKDTRPELSQNAP